MAPDQGELPRHATCPACGAALRPDSPWCTLCYADLRPPVQAPEQPAAPVSDPLTQPLIDFLPGALPPVVPVVPQPRAVVGPDPLTGPLPTAVPEPTWPCLSCGAANPLLSDRCGACGAAFLAEVATSGRTSLVLPVVGDIGRLSRTQRTLGALAVVLLLLVLVAILSSLFSGSGAGKQDQRTPSVGPVSQLVPTGQPTAGVPVAPGPVVTVPTPVDTSIGPTTDPAPPAPVEGGTGTTTS